MDLYLLCSKIVENVCEVGRGPYGPKNIELRIVTARHCLDMSLLHLPAT